MLKRFKYRIYPTEAQNLLLNKHMGSVRFIYNLALETKKLAFQSGVNLSRYDLQVQLKELKTDYEWLNEINAQSLQSALMHLDLAYVRFFKKVSDFPRYKRKVDRQSFNLPQRININNGKVYFPKFKDGIDIVLHKPIEGIIKQASVIKTPTGKFFISILFETDETCPLKRTINEKTTIGLDLGIKSFLVTSEGVSYDSPRYLKKSLSKLKYTQRKFSKQKGKRTRLKLSYIHEKVANQRLDFLHKVSSKLVNNHDSLAIETLKVSNMLKNHHLAQAISDSGWGMFVNMLEYKSEWYGKNILKIGTFEPSSKTCSCCGSINKELTLKDREWTCLNCNAILDRDINAAINIKTFALKNHLSTEHRLKNQNELPTLVGVMTSEASIISSSLSIFDYESNHER